MSYRALIVVKHLEGPKFYPFYNETDDIGDFKTVVKSAAFSLLDGHDQHFYDADWTQEKADDWAVIYADFIYEVLPYNGTVWMLLRNGDEVQVERPA